MVHLEILNQLGGRRFLAMTGSKNLIYSAQENNYLAMKLTTNKLRAQYLKIVLTPADTYTMIFSKVVKVQSKDFGFKTDELKVIKEIENVYCDQLQEIFTENTGLYTYL